MNPAQLQVTTHKFQTKAHSTQEVTEVKDKYIHQQNMVGTCHCYQLLRSVCKYKVAYIEEIKSDYIAVC